MIKKVIISGIVLISILMFFATPTEAGCSNWECIRDFPTNCTSGSFVVGANSTSWYCEAVADVFNSTLWNRTAGVLFPATAGDDIKTSGIVNATNITIGDPWTFWTTAGDLYLYEEEDQNDYIFYQTGKFWASHNFRWVDANRSIDIGTDNSESYYSTTTMGWQAGNDQTGQFCTFVGHQAGEDNTANYATALGYDALELNTGTHASGFGAFAGYNNSGGETTAFGYYSGHDNAGEDGTFMGPSAGRGNWGDYVIGIGRDAARDNDPSGDYLVAIGYHSGQNNLQEKNTFVGGYAGTDNNAKLATGLGYYSLDGNTGDAVSCVGGYCGSQNTGNQATGIGYEAIKDNTAQLAIGIGVSACEGNSGSGTVCIGYEAGLNNAEDAQFIVEHSFWNTLPLIQGDIANGQVGIHTNDPQYGIDVNGTGAIGDRTNGDFAHWASDGELTLNGTARVTKYTWLPADALQAAGAKPATQTLNGNGFAIYDFADNLEQQIQFNLAFPTDMDKNEDVYIGIGWSSPTIGGVADWELTYLITGLDDSTDQPGTLIQQYEYSSTTADGLTRSAFTIDHNLLTNDDICMHVILERDGNDANDNLTASAELHGVQLVYTSDKLGEPT